MDKVDQAGGVAMVDAADKAGMTIAPASQRRKRLMPKPISKPSTMIAVCTHAFPPLRKPIIGNSATLINKPVVLSEDVEEAAALQMIATEIPTVT